MNTLQGRNFRSALIVLFCICALLGSSAASILAGPNLLLGGIQNAAGASSHSVAEQELGTFEPAERAIENDRATAVSLPTMAMLGPNQKLAAIFPMIGLIAAVTVTQLLRRRRIAQLRSSSSTGQ